MSRLLVAWGRLRRSLAVAAALAVLAAPAFLLVACGGTAGGGAEATAAAERPGPGGDGDGELIVLAASSLGEPLSRYAEEFEAAEVKTSFAGSDELAEQIRQGAGADVFASADTEYPAALFREGLVEKPVEFAANELVIAVPAGSDIRSLADLAKPGVKLVIGDASVPVGSYTRTVLGRLPAAEREAIRANVRSEETQVSSVVAKLEAGAADAGFVYRTDVRTAAELEVVRLPAALRPDVAYAAAVVADSDEQRAAEEFLHGLLAGRGEERLREAGFLPPP